MGGDSLSPIAPARVRCLLLPYGRVTRSSFTAYVTRLQNVSIVRLGDISPSKAPESGMFTPLAFPSGSVIYDFADSHQAPSHRSLLPFEMHRETLVVLAISNGKEYSGAAADPDNAHIAVREFSECIMNLKDTYPSALVHRLLLFDFDDDMTRLPKDTVRIPPTEKAPSNALRTVMADLTSAFLAELGSLAKSIQVLPNIDTPKAVGIDADLDKRRASRPNSRISMTSASGIPSPAPDSARLQHRSSMPPHLSLPEASSSSNQRSLTGTSTPPANFDEITGVAGRLTSGGSDHSTHTRNQAQSRISIIIGSLYLLAGRWPDAVKELSAGAQGAKTNSDYAWHAKSLDLLLVALLMSGWGEVEFEIPPVVYPFGDKYLANRVRTAKGSTTNGDKAGGDEDGDSHDPHIIALLELSPLIPDLANNILHLYARAAEYNAARVPQVVYSETVIRLARILWLLRSQGGTMTPTNLQGLILGLKNLQPKHRTSVDLTKFSSRMEIASFVHRAMPQTGDEFMETSDRMRILAGIAAVLSDLGFQRKKGLVLRELLAALLPALVQSRKDSAAELGLHPAASLSTSFELAASGSHPMLGQSNGIGGGLKQLLGLVCDIYGVINIDPQANSNPTSAEDEYEAADKISQRTVEQASRRTYGNSYLKTDVLKSCINVCEALPDLSGLLRFSSSLLTTTGSGLAPGPATTDSAPSLPIEDQIRLSTNISRAVNAAKQLGLDDTDTDYWDDFLLRDIVLMPNEAGKNMPVGRRKADLELATAGPVAEKKEGPFIFNPFGSKPTTATRETLLVANEEAIFVLLLQNLYDMDLEIEWIKFDTNDMPIDVAAKNIIVGPYRTQNVQLLCTPRSAGRLSLSGCIAKIKGCRPRRFPLFREPWRMPNPLKMKHHGLAGLVSHKDTSAIEAVDATKAIKTQSSETPRISTFDALVIAAQPTLVVKSTSLPQSALMILDGETRTFTFTLKNASDTSIDLFLVSLHDSTLDQLQETTADKAVSPAGLYEAAFSAQNRPGIRLLPHEEGDDISIKPHGELVLEIEVFGKIGLTQAMVSIEYCHLGVPRSEVQDRFFTRQLTVPFEITVNSSLGLLHNDFLPLPADPRQLVSAEVASVEGGVDDFDAAAHFKVLLQQLTSDNENLEYCLLVLDFNNAWSEPLSFSLDFQPCKLSEGGAAEQSSEPYRLSSVVQPQRTTRILLPFPKLLLENSHAPVPTLDPRHRRQFVVSTGEKGRPDMERLARELFWYREEVLKRLHATWEVPRRARSYDTNKQRGRHGEVDLRRLLMTPRMLEATRWDDLSISMTVQSADEHDVRAASPSTPAPALSAPAASCFQVRAGAFITLEATLHSRIPHTVHPLLRLQPALRHQPYHIALDLGRKVAVNGVLQRALPALPPGGTHTARVGLALLAPGEYEVAAVVEEVRIGAEEEKLPKTPLSALRKNPETADFGLHAIGKRTERRVWYARQACLFDVLAADEGLVGSDQE